MFKDLPSRIRTIYRKAKLSYSLVNQIATDNPKVSAYLPPAVYDVPPAVYEELEAFKEKRGLQSVEMAVTTILAEYFEQLQPALNPAPDTTDSRLEFLEAKCNSLSETVAELQTAIATLQARSHLLNQNDSPDLSATSVQLDQSQIVEPTPESRSHVDYSEPLDQTAHHNIQISTSESLEPTTLPGSLNEPPDSPSQTNPLLIQPPVELPSTDLEAEAPSEAETAPMTQAALARRLGVSTSSISRMQSKPNFPGWSQQKDPEGIAWVRAANNKGFHPQNNN